MKHMTRKQARSWLAPIRAALSQLKVGEVDAIRGYAVTRLHVGDKYERLDWCINGFVALINRIIPELDTAVASKLAKRLESGVMLTVRDVDSVFALLNRVEDRLVGRPMIEGAVMAEQIVIELESLGLKEAA